MRQRNQEVMVTKNKILTYRQLEEAIGTITDLIHVLSSPPILSHTGEHFLS